MTDRNGPVLGLGVNDFEVLDNAIPQQVDLVSYEEIPLNVVLALDMSASLDGQRLDDLRSAGIALLDGLQPTDQAALVTFSQFVSQGTALTSNFGVVREALNRSGGSGQTSLIDATFTGIMVGERDVGRSLLIVFSDGVDTASVLRPDAVLDIARRSDTVVYGVEVGKGKLSFLRDLSKTTGGRAIAIESTRDVRATFLSILNEFRQRYLISFSPRGVEKMGWHALDVRVKSRGNVTVRARPGYFSK